MITVNTQPRTVNGFEIWTTFICDGDTVLACCSAPDQLRSAQRAVDYVRTWHADKVALCAELAACLAG